MIKEERKLQEGGPEGLEVYAANLSKGFKTINPLKPILLAVHDVSFAVRNGEVFALLGVNGAGKSTTFKMLTNDIEPTRGEVFIQGESVSRSTRISNTVGYCPQTNILFENLTVDEHLLIYSAVKGIPYEKGKNLLMNY